MHILENKYIKIAINALGAELKSVYSKESELEYMWQGDPVYWSKTSPVLFPIVGGLKDNMYIFKGQKYSLPRHGFAREMPFEVEYQSENEVRFLLKSNAETLKNYPFEFEFRIIYTIDDEGFRVKYFVKNTGKTSIYFSVGAHPAFNVPLFSELAYSDYELNFNDDDTLFSYPLTVDGLVKEKPFEIKLQNENLKLKKELFHKDALVFKTLKSNEITLKSAKSIHGLRMTFDGFPYYGIWAAKDADFVCLEPWCGIADPENTNKELTEKEGIMKLEGGASFEVCWSLEIW
jgi:galactose mutarotase-like enzyme